ncbi:hypothetical protein RND71_031994 [Anisodus tanguticus]|uniref:DUF4218 domain-containing protein n=1 Tax=Anisodus tanguticus TaxID=243964 RepID=A0AAE1V5D3_9SOLA|nr:hypothetical protein RND71_031994 [Anisodus tanguticus]
MRAYVRNKEKLEGSIAEDYFQHECHIFCSMYFNNRIQTKFNYKDKNDKDDKQHEPFQLSVFQSKGKPLGRREFVQLSYLEWQQAQLYILKNCPEVQSFIDEDDGPEDITTDFGMANVVDDSNNYVVISPRSDVPLDIVSASEEEEFTYDDEEEAVDEEDDDEFDGELSEEEEDGDTDLFGLTEDGESECNIYQGN